MYVIDRRKLLKTGVSFAYIFTAGGMSRALADTQTTLTLYNGQHARTTAALIAAFTKQTGIKIEARKGRSSQLANQIAEEGAASPADIFYSEESPPLAALASKDMLAKIDGETLKQVSAKYTAKDGTWIGTSARCRVVVYNKDMIKQSELPASVLDFATAAWKDRIAFVPTSGAFLQQIVAIEKLKGREAALNWLKGLKAYGRIYNGNGGAMRAVERGEIATALINNYYWFGAARETGADNMKSALHYFGNKDPGALITVSAAGILKSSKNIQAAQQFLAFMVSAEGQQIIVNSAAEYPLRDGVKSPFALKPFATLDPPPITPADLDDAASALALEREAGLA
jgi:iron(III) transport system substrate-binding protein